MGYCSKFGFALRLNLRASLKTGLNRENRQGASAARKADEARLYALRGGVTRCCEAKAQSDGTDAVATKLSLVDRSRRRALLILSQTRFLEVTFIEIIRIMTENI